jgi:hypothetical protein
VVRTFRRQVVADQNPVPDDIFPDPWHGAYFGSLVLVLKYRLECIAAAIEFISIF